VVYGSAKEMLGEETAANCNGRTARWCGFAVQTPKLTGVPLPFAAFPLLWERTIAFFLKPWAGHAGMALEKCATFYADRAGEPPLDRDLCAITDFIVVTTRRQGAARKPLAAAMNRRAGGGN